MIALLAVAAVSALPAAGCVHEPGRPAGALARALAAMPMMEIRFPEHGPTPSRDIERSNKAVNRFFRAHTAKRPILLRVGAVTIEGDAVYEVLVTVDGRIWMGADDRADDWGSREILLCASPSARLDLVAAESARGVSQTVPQVLQFEVPEEMHCTLSPEMPVTMATEIALMKECSPHDEEQTP
jgi:hypothetical protein